MEKKLGNELEKIQKGDSTWRLENFPSKSEPADMR
jgi:hypothetical protein